MLFHAVEKWWGDRGKRDWPHEGLDLCLYRDGQGRVRRLGEGLRIPALYGGTVVGFCKDFMGETVMIEHSLAQQGQFYTMYGHTRPESELQVGQVVREGEVIARLADATRSKTNALPHLHISLGWAACRTGCAIAYDKLDWETIPDTLTLLDPLQVLTRRPARVVNEISDNK
jgi:murein DD-endopeptidase MepM/ murein hydrolase activator NlpD